MIFQQQTLRLHQKIRIVHGANGHAYKFVHPLRHTHLGRYQKTEVTTRELRDINGPKELYNILQDKHKIIQQHNLLILLIILEIVTCQDLTKLRS